LHFVTWIGSLLYTSVAISTLLVCTTPLWTTLYETLVERKPAPRHTWPALALAAAGLVLVVANTAAPAPVAGRAIFGDALALAGAFGIGAYFLIVRRFGTHPASGQPLATTQIVARTFSWAAVTLLAATLLAHAPWPGADATAWGGIVAMALVSQLLGHTMLNASLRTFTPSTIATSILLEPVIAAVLAAIAFRERLGPSTLAGGACILGALWIVLRAAPTGKLKSVL
jgi:drug/metabolite transporter (DMT)-like permease